MRFPQLVVKIINATIPLEKVAPWPHLGVYPAISKTYLGPGMGPLFKTEPAPGIILARIKCK